MTHTVLLLLLLAASATAAQPAADGEGRAADARAFLAVLRPDQHDRAALAFDDPDRLVWGRTPGERAGVAVAELGPEARLALHALLRSALSAQGYLRATATMLGERVAAAEEVELSGETELGPEQYWVAVYGTPGVGRWGWRLEGHHLSLRFVFDGDRPVSVTPAAWGAYPTPCSTRSGQKMTRPADSCECSATPASARPRCLRHRTG